MRHINCTVRRSELSSIAACVLPWEIPVLEFLHGVENVTVTGEVDMERAVDGPQAEFQRLENAYGKDAENGMSFVAQVYGNGGIGIAKLGAFMEEHAQGDPLSK
jgi:hypothetical protein